ncbi:hypothetical protein [Cellulomonas triticagri]|nr:hypothetical protein [Cellulomonas triticagri]
MRSVLGLQSIGLSEDRSAVRASTFSQRDCTASSWISWNKCH